MKPTFFKSGSEFRAWLETHHRSAKELLVGFYKKGSGIPSITYPEADKKAWAFYHSQAPLVPANDDTSGLRLRA